ncbi:hypothetical protein NSB20_20545 [Bacteroides acidifaciens]|uniref:hypothetical protein n=1 Tax=Bacteroides acidifaciens TaxID=85831 RepID=UPI002149ACB4|nr:hypothetical protein [Bacteroides acidifaciens]MCR2007850.1 hypothetical protein [Bacteroides acidifaciens]
MENYQNIEQTKEFQLAKVVEGGLNDYSFNAKNFAAAIPMMHPTLQQSLYRLIRECLKVMADDSRRYDDRNRASHEDAKAMLEYLQKKGQSIPFI